MISEMNTCQSELDEAPKSNLRGARLADEGLGGGLREAGVKH